MRISPVQASIWSGALSSAGPATPPQVTSKLEARSVFSAHTRSLCTRTNADVSVSDEALQSKEVRARCCRSGATSRPLALGARGPSASG